MCEIIATHVDYEVSYNIINFYCKTDVPMICTIVRLRGNLHMLIIPITYRRDYNIIIEYRYACRSHDHKIAPFSQNSLLSSQKGNLHSK